MMKRIISSAFAAAAILSLSLASCSKEELFQDDSPEYASGVVTVGATLSDVLTKVCFDPSYSAGKPTGLALTWAEGDAIRVYNHADRSQYDDFTVDASSVGKKTGKFQGTPTHLGGATSYDVEVIGGAGFNYAAQTQPSDGVTTGLKYLASVSGVTSLENIEFTSISSVLAVTVQLPSTDVAAKVKSVDIRANAKIFAGGDALTLTLESLGDADADGILHLFATLPEGSTAVPEGTTLLVHVNVPGETQDVYTRFIELGAKNFASGKLNAINFTTKNAALSAGAADDGTPEHPYLIGDKYQMQSMHSLLVVDETKYFTLIDNVDLDGVAWTALNNNGDDKFGKGMFFDGAGYTISNLTCNSGSYPSFAGVVYGTVKDVTFDGAAITAGGATSGVLGGYIGTTTGSRTANISGITVMNSSVTGATKVRVGGIGGYVCLAGSTVSDCHVLSTTVESTVGKVGGMFGEVGAFTVENCTAENVSVTGADKTGMGGLVGYINGATVQNCAVSATLTGVTAVGGIVGYMEAGTLTGNTASGSIANTTFYSGGIVGRMIAGSVTGCSAAVDITNTRNNYAHAGGLIGTIEGGSVEKCHATGNVSSTASTVGGLVGSITAGDITISKCYATGAVTETNAELSKQAYGGLVGNIANGTTVAISDCYAAGSVSAAKYSGGFIGTIGEANVTVTNGYTTSAVVGGATWTCCVFCGSYSGTVDQYLHCSGFVGWNTSNRKAWSYSNDQQVHDGNYMGKEGSVYEQAVALGGWDFENVWTTDSTPALR